MEKTRVWYFRTSCWRIRNWWTSEIHKRIRAYVFLDFNSLNSPFLGFWVIHTGYRMFWNVHWTFQLSDYSVFTFLRETLLYGLNKFSFRMTTSNSRSKDAVSKSVDYSIKVNFHCSSYEARRVQTIYQISTWKVLFFNIRKFIYYEKSGRFP